MVWVPNSPPEGYIHLKLNKGVYSLKTWDGEGVGSEDPAENVPFNFPGEKLSFFLWIEHRKGLEDSLVGGFSPTHLKNMLVKLDHFPKGWDEHKNVSNHLMFFCSTTLGPRKLPQEPRIQKSKMSGSSTGRIDGEVRIGIQKKLPGIHIDTCQPFPLNIPLKLNCF